MTTAPAPEVITGPRGTFTVVAGPDYPLDYWRVMGPQGRTFSSVLRNEARTAAAELAGWGDTPRTATSYQGFPWCRDRECRAKWNHAHGVNPDYPTVVALATTPAERAALVMRGFTIWAPNY